MFLLLGFKALFRPMNVKQTVLLTHLVCCVFCLSVGSVPAAQAQQNAFAAHTQVELIANSREVQPGDELWVGLRMQMEPGWHVYWVNPGDSGLAPSLKWTLPSVVTAGPLHWPYPQRIEAPPLASYGYFSETVLFTPMQVKNDAAVGDVLHFSAQVKWLACVEECLPGQADLSLEIPVAQVSLPNERFEKLCAPYLLKIPSGRFPGKASAELGDGRLDLYFSLSKQGGEPAGAYFFPFSEKIVEHAAVQPLTRENGMYKLSISASDLFSVDEQSEIEGVLVLDFQGKAPRTAAYHIKTVIGKGPSSPEPGAVALPGAGAMTIGLSLLFAFIGGLILNLLPCVLPVLSIKILSLIEHANESRAKLWQQGLLFTLGVLVMFWVLAGALFVLKAVGVQAGWGFQLQNPAVIVALALLFLFLAFQLWGFFDVGQGAARLGNSFLSGQGRSQAFFQGLVTTLCATPCTAPFMGAALGFALVQPFYLAFLIFTALGMGMSAPYLLLARFPQLLRFVPKPGQWMDRLKKFFGFVLLGVVIWLAWIFGRQKGLDALTGLYFFLLFCALSLWLVSAGGPSQRRWKKTVWAVLPAAIGCVVFVVSGGMRTPSEPLAVPQTEGQQRWQPYSKTLLNESLAQGKAVFLDFTAAWCLTCQVNEQFALNDPRVTAALSQEGLVAMKADWTNFDAEITQALSRYGRNSIPLYVYYSADSGTDPQPVILPEVITPQMVLDVLGETRK